MKRLFGHHYVLVLLLSNCHFTSKIFNLIFQLHYEETFSDNLTKVIVNRVMIVHLVDLNSAYSSKSFTRMLSFKQMLISCSYNKLRPNTFKRQIYVQIKY